jgi:hypothetical protein
MCKVGQTGVPMVDIPCCVGIDVAKDLRARPGGPTLKKIPGTLDNQDSCSARTSLCAVKVAWKNVVTPRVYRYPPLGLCRRPLVLPCRPPDTPRIPHRVSHSGGTTGAPPRGAVFQRALARLACWDVVPGLCFRLLGVFARPHWPPHSRLPGGHLLSVPCRISGPCRSMTRLWPCDQP